MIHESLPGLDPGEYRVSEKTMLKQELAKLWVQLKNISL